ncbi:LysR substrate-binding domain-containing protein [Azospirillum sp. TSO22-1]|uniref:LysR substrate-binding domain-containing protein n=1 Tax=Azospirillum sp. TSO22-1 TaxID=716789 RepID=UPI000D6050FF|nr:LysR substrate-binding domain-containing protein [Azospirillum sp. TSO22-1]PWC34836.1 LysR family transcriptional regulator [Azospirillum sp. TSO22-1]
MPDSDIMPDLPVFVAAAEAGGFAAAAARLNLSRSAIGKTIARLEGRLGVRLFHRTTRSLTLTEDGQAFFEHCRRALNEVQAARTMLDSGRREAAGRLRVSVPVLFGRQCVAPVLIRLAEAHPKLELDINFSDRFVDLVEDGFDLAVRNGPLQNWPGLAGRRVAYQHMRVCAAPRYLEKHGVPRELHELSGHRAVLYGRPGRVKQWLFPQPGGALAEAMPPSRLHFDDLGTIRDATLDGHGLAWLPCWLVRDDLAAGRLVTVLDHLPSHVFDSHLLWLQTPHLPMRVRLAIDALAAALPEATSLPPSLRPS